MEPITGMLILQGLSMAADVFGGISGGKAAKKAARDEARAEGVLTSAKLQQLIDQERVLRGQTITRGAASGVKTGTGRYGGPAGSLREVLAEQRRSFEQERLTIAQVGATKASAALSRGGMVADQARYGAVSSVAQTGSNMFSLWAQYKPPSSGGGR